MVLPRESEPWRRMSRFRRQSQMKPLAAEVLGPRCSTTEATGTLADGGRGSADRSGGGRRLAVG